MKLLVSAVLLLLSTTAYGTTVCGNWVRDANQDPITDERIVYTFSMSESGDGGLGFRCSNGDRQLAFVTQRFIITSDDIFGPYSNITIRVDKQSPITLEFRKVNNQLWLHNADAVMMSTLYNQFKAGYKIAMRVHEPNGYEDYSFYANGFTECSRSLVCW